jgi:ribonucleoside-diphosphate reductase alpha chain
MNDWHTCKASGRDPRLQSVLGIHVPGRHACNLASANLLTFYEHHDKSSSTSTPTSISAALWTVVLEISVMMAQFPSKAIAELSYEFRTLGLGFANIGGPLDDHGVCPTTARKAARCAAL